MERDGKAGGLAMLVFYIFYIYLFIYNFLLLLFLS